jgi:hypothetical protein
MEAARIEHFLPENFRLAATNPRGVAHAMLQAMEALHAPDEAIIERIDSFFSPIRVDPAHEDFVLLQASWLGLERYFNWTGGRPGLGTPSFPSGIANLRLLVAEAAELLRERGMESTLIRFLELATGTKGFAIADGLPDGAPSPFHFTLFAPEAVRAQADLVARIVAGERPAHATYSILYGSPPKKKGNA